jgi:hypothetical protein
LTPLRRPVVGARALETAKAACNGVA